MRYLRRILFLALAVVAALPVSAQRYRGERQVIRGGVVVKADTLSRRGADSLAIAPDSLSAEPNDMHLSAADSLKTDSIKADSLKADSLAAGQVPLPEREGLTGDDVVPEDDNLTEEEGVRDSLAASSVEPLDNLLAEYPEKTKQRERKPFISDSMGISRVCWVSAVLPGFGQIYNKQYWKLPILYSTVGTSLGMFIYENNRYKPLKRQFDQLTNEGLYRTEQLNRVQTKMIRSNTLREVYLGAAIVSYLYFIGDAAICYSTNEVSNIKRATTLSMICPGAGQIYNKSYWRVPIVMGGIATTIYCIDWNNRGYQRFKKAYRLRAGYDKEPELYPNGSTDEFGGRYSASFLKNLRDSYRRNRDLCIILTAGMYLLQIVDAHVDAHLRDFDISDDLSMNIMPMVDYAYAPSIGRTSPLFGMNLSINF